VSFHFEIVKANGPERSFERPLFKVDQKRLLEEFCACAKRLNETSFAKNWSKTRISIHYGTNGQISDCGTLPSDEEIDAFLHRLRPIFLQKEALHFEKVANIVGYHLKDPVITDCIRYWKRHYSGRESQNTFEIRVGSQLLNSEAFFDDYINALEYHRDPEKRKRIDQIAEHFPLSAQKPIFVLLLQFRLNAINKLASFLLTCFDREDGRPITIKIPE
jgi:hypothetical protein